MVSVPELKQYLDKTLKIQLNGTRIIQGNLTGYDFFLNLNLSDCVELKTKKKKGELDEVIKIGQCVVRGNSVVSIEVV